MPNYDDVNQLVISSIQEYLDIAHLCMNLNKFNSDDIYGMAALNLLCCAMDAIGSFYDNSKNKGSLCRLASNYKGLSQGSHYKAFFNKYKSEFNFSDDFVEKICKKIRNRCVHNAGIHINTQIVNDCNSTIIWKDNGNKDVVDLNQLYNRLKQCFEQTKQELNKTTSLSLTTMTMTSLTINEKVVEK